MVELDQAAGMRSEAAALARRLHALALKLDGKPAAPETVRRKRAVFYTVLEYAVELEELESNPIDRVSWNPPKVSIARILRDQRQTAATVASGCIRRNPGLLRWRG